MSGSFVIRAAMGTDAAAIAAVCSRAARVAYADLVTGDYLVRVIAHFYGADRIRREVAPSPDWFGFIVALDGEAVVGVSGTGRSAQHPEACELFALYVDPDSQRRGVGRQLVAHAVGVCEANGARRLDVAVLPGNQAAIRFYEACGFTFAAERPIYAPHGAEGGPATALVYARPL